MTFPEPVFRPQMIEERRPDGYWIDTFDVDGDGLPDLVGYGLGEGQVTWYRNPTWERTLIRGYAGPVGMHHADLDGDGREDIVICHQYGATMVDCDPQGGLIHWLQNPGPGAGDQQWTARYVGRATAMHRLRVGHFTRTDRWQVLGLPIVGGPQAVHSDVPVMLFTQPDDLFGATEWQAETIDHEFYHVIHGVTLKQFGTRDGSVLDSVLLASQEGISWLRYDPVAGSWRHDLIGRGELGEQSVTGFFGSGDVDAGRIGSDPFAYIPAVEPFHGNTVAVYTKSADAELTEVRWQRHVLDVFGGTNEKGEGPGHFVICADFDGDGDDEFLVALRGPAPWRGVFYYKAVDAARGQFLKWRVAEESAARIAVADFTGDGRLDFATIGYSVAGYYVDENPKVMVYYNEFARPRPGTQQQSASPSFVPPAWNLSVGV